MAIELQQLSEGAKKRAEWFLSRFLMTTIAIIVVLLTLTQVPQVHNVLFQLHGKVDGADWPYVLLWFALMTAILFLGINLADLIVEPNVEEAAAESGHQKRIPRTTAWTAVGVIVIVAFVLTLTADASDPSQSFGFATWLPLPLPIFLIALAALLAPFHAFCPKGLRSQKHRKIFIVGRLVCFSLILIAIGEFIWWLAGAKFARFVSYQAYTVWAVYQMLFLLIMLGRAIDALSMQGLRWIRAAAVALVVLYAFSWGPTDVGRAQQDTRSLVEIDAEITKRWFEALKAKIDSLPTNGPVVFVGASGGGSRAALFTALVLDSLERVALFDTTVADRIVLISAVSGGSLASAYSAAHSAESDHAEEGVDYSWRHTIASDLKQRVKLSVSELIAAAEEEARSETLAEHEQHAYQMAVERLREMASTAEPVSPEILKSEFVDHMNMDFMAPLLRGCVYLWQSRGRSLSTFWEKHFEWKDYNNRVGIRHDSKHGRIPPVLLLNATLVEYGNRLTIGIPALPPHLLDREDCPAVSLSSIDALYEVSLAEAVRLSANFPWGIPVARLRTSNGSNHLLDGGIADNTAIDMLYEIIASIEYFAALDAKTKLTAEEELLREKASELWKELRRRGVVIIEIDSGAKPSQLGKVAKLFPEVVNPIQTLKKSSFARLVADKDDYLERIDKLLEPEPISPSTDIAELAVVAPRLPPLTYMCLDKEHVMTAWALGANDKAKVIARFIVEDEVNRHKISGHGHSYEDLYALATRSLEDAYKRLARSPLDVALVGGGGVGRGELTTEQMMKVHSLAGVPNLAFKELSEADLARVVSQMQRARHEEWKQQAQLERKARAAIYERRKR